MNAAERIATVNKQLRAGKVRARLKLRGDRVSLVATLPPKPDSKRTRPYQQVISTGIAATATGIKQATAKAKILAGELDTDSFVWANWQRGFSARCQWTVAEAVAEFEQYYRANNEIKDRSWKGSWMRSFRQVPQDRRVSADLLTKAVLEKEENSQTRKTTCHHLQALAKFCGVEVDLKQYQGNYGPNKVKARNLPSDDDIVAAYYMIDDPAWRWIYGIIAAAGLRPHEAFFCEWSDEGLEVLKGKTGPRTVRELFYPEWVDDWELRRIRLPRISYESAYSTGELGRRVSMKFKKFGIDIDVYDLRHASAARMALFGLPTAIAAKFMGHSADVHLKRYQRHINKAIEQRAVDIAVASSDRPLPPSLEKT